LIVTSSNASLQGAFEMDHLKTLLPRPNAVTVVFGDPGLAMVPAPLTTVHFPVPMVGMLPLNGAVVPPQMIWSLPAFAVVGIPVPVMVTVLVEELQGGLAMVHLNTFGPIPKPVTVDVGEFGLVIVPCPLTSTHVPVPAVAVFAAKVASVPQTVWAEPALDIVVASFTVIFTESVEFPLAHDASEAFR
jgi:hypothetical protein